MSSASATSAKASLRQSILPDSSQSFPKSRRLLRRPDFQSAYSEGVKFPGPYFLLFVRRRDDEGSCRVGLTASRKVGNAVVRNRAKRLLREAVRRNWEAMPRCCDCVLHVRGRIGEATYAQVEAEILRTMRKGRTEAERSRAKLEAK